MAHIILVPGLWLAADSWNAIATRLADAGHSPHALSMPGIGEAPADPPTHLDDWIDSVVHEIDAIAEPVVLVGHSGGGNVVWGATDRRPDRVARTVFVDTMPPPAAGIISEFPVEHGVIPFPGWDFFDAEDVHDLDEQLRARTLPLTVSVPEHVPTDPIRLSDERRHSVPVSLLMGALDEEAVATVVAAWPAFEAEYQALVDREVVTLGSGHWPQFSAPDRLTDAIIAAIR